MSHVVPTVALMKAAVICNCQICSAPWHRRVRIVCLAPEIAHVIDDEVMREREACAVLLDQLETELPTRVRAGLYLRGSLAAAIRAHVEEVHGLSIYQ